MTYEEMEEWDQSYEGELMMLTRAELVERIEWDSDELTNANYHGEAESLYNLAKLIKKLPASTQMGWFGWSVNDLGPVRQCMVEEGS